MSERNYEIGYRKPPKAYQYQKGHSGNLTGCRRKPAPTLARAVEEAWMVPIIVATGNVQGNATGFELITMQLLIRIADGSRKAHRVFRKYEAFAKTQPRIRQDNFEYEVNPYSILLETGEWAPKRLKKIRKSLGPEECRRCELRIRIARMKAGLEEIEILDGMTAQEASDLYHLLIRQPWQPKRPRQRNRKGRLVASEIFDRVVNSPVTLNSAGHITTVPRMMGVVRRLLSNAVRGDIKSAEMLIDLHAASLKYGDFYPETKHIRA
jgi:hypothetical protein